MANLQQLSTDRGVAIAIVYDQWFDSIGGLPTAWTQIGRWSVSENVILGGSAVSFYATAPGERAKLVTALALFDKDLPSDVVRDGEYLAQNSSR
jgi:hypothetical protein